MLIDMSPPCGILFVNEINVTLSPSAAVKVRQPARAGEAIALGGSRVRVFAGENGWHHKIKSFHNRTG